ncbi:hypothetical protein BDV18DRAFT_33305 [Aspergillus unguis]
MVPTPRPVIKSLLGKIPLFTIICYPPYHISLLRRLFIWAVDAHLIPRASGSDEYWQTCHSFSSVKLCTRFGAGLLFYFLFSTFFFF